MRSLEPTHVYIVEKCFFPHSKVYRQWMTYKFFNKRKDAVVLKKELVNKNRASYKLRPFDYSPYLYRIRKYIALESKDKK